MQVRVELAESGYMSRVWLDDTEITHSLTGININTDLDGTTVDLHMTRIEVEGIAQARVAGFDGIERLRNRLRRHTT